MALQNRISSADNNKRFVSRVSYDGTGYSSSGYPPPIHHNNAPEIQQTLSGADGGETKGWLVNATAEEQEFRNYTGDDHYKLHLFTEFY